MHKKVSAKLSKTFFSKSWKFRQKNLISYRGGISNYHLSEIEGGEKVISQQYVEWTSFGEFDAYIKKKLKYRARSYFQEKKNMSEREANFSELSIGQLGRLAAVDEYFSDSFEYNVNGIRILVNSYEISKALDKLSVKQLNAILLSIYMNMTDDEISKFLNIPRSTVAYRRVKAKEVLAELLKELVL